MTDVAKKVIARNNVPIDVSSLSSLTYVVQQALAWPVIHPIVLDICIAFAPLRLPPYVLLEVIDFLAVEYDGSDENESMMHRVSHVKKINLIVGVQRSQRNIDEQQRRRVVLVRTLDDRRDVRK